jgi:hypothetical protein
MNNNTGPYLPRLTHPHSFNFTRSASNGAALEPSFVKGLVDQLVTPRKATVDQPDGLR